MKQILAIAVLLATTAAVAQTAPIRTCENGGPGVLDVAILRSLNCPVLSREEALYVANHLSKFSLSQGLCAHNQVFACPPPKPERGSAKYITEHPSQYSVPEVMRAIDEVKKARP